MKKLIRVLAVIIVVVLAVSLFAGCSNKSKLIGKWQCKEDGASVTLEFKKNGDLIVGMSFGGETESEKGKWKMGKGDKLMISEDGDDWEETEYELKNGKLILDMGGSKVTFKRK